MTSEINRNAAQGCNVLVARGAYDDFESFEAAARHWNLDFRQLDRGPFRARIELVCTEKVQILRVCLNRLLLQRGGSPPGMRTFALPDLQSTVIDWCRRDLSPATIATFGDGGAFEAVSRPGFDVCTISIDNDHLVRAAQAVGVFGSLENLGPHEVVLTGDRTSLDRLRSLAGRLLQRSRNPGADADEALARVLEHDIPALVLQIVSAQRGSVAVPLDRMRDRALRRAQAFIDSYGTQPLSLAELCHMSGASERTLRYAFIDRFGVTPKTFLMAHRLNGARRDLRAAEPTRSIADIADDWGFWHMGQFAADYRQFFGELPSQALGAAVG